MPCGPQPPARNYSRNGLRYQSDVTDEEWRVIEPYLPPAKGIGRPRGWPLREIVNGIFYVMRSGCPWRQLPKDLPPWSTVYRWFAAWRDACLFEKINHALVITDRERVGREASPLAAIIDSQSIKTTEAGGPRGYDAGKKINGRKRHALVDTDGRGLLIEPHPASIQDRDGGSAPIEVVRLEVCLLASRRTAMPKKRYTPEEIVAKLRQVDVLVSQGQNIADAIRQIGVSEVTYYRWRQEYGGLKTEQVKRLKELETENARLRKAISDLTLDKLILQEAARGNF